jgi:Clp amino terminal domain, pathogenicity island component
MFERYTEKARRAVFFARYEASQFGSKFITSEHLLLGILRDDKAVVRQLLLDVEYESARREIEAHAEPGKGTIPTSVDLPLSEDAKQVLKHGAEEAERLNSRHIGTEHLLLALMRDKDFPSAKVLVKLGADLESLRKRVEALPGRVLASEFATQYRSVPLRAPHTVEIHGNKLNLEEVRDRVSRLKPQPYFWERKLWQARDVVYERNGKRFSFDTSLANDESKFVLVKGGWKKDSCIVCGWELCETEDAAHNSGYTNGRDWVCDECHSKFIAGNYFGSAYGEMT